jgi:hypothetical protein
MGADLGHRLPETGQERVQYRDWRPRGDTGPLVKGCLPKVLEPDREVFSHPGRDVTVDAAHSGHLVAHPFRLQHVADVEVVKPGFVAMTQAVRCQSGAQGAPGGDRHGLGGLLA